MCVKNEVQYKGGMPVFIFYFIFSSKHPSSHMTTFPLHPPLLNSPFLDTPVLPSILLPLGKGPLFRQCPDCFLCLKQGSSEEIPLRGYPHSALCLTLPGNHCSLLLSALRYTCPYLELDIYEALLQLITHASVSPSVLRVPLRQRVLMNLLMFLISHLSSLASHRYGGPVAYL